MTLAILDARDKEYVVVAVGTDLIATYVQQAIAAGQTAQEVLDAILAAGLSEGVFPSEAAGLSGTTDGQYFWVGSGGTVTLYLNDTGAGDEIAELATAAVLALKANTADLASPTGGEMVGFSQSGSASSRSTQAKNRETLTITDFPGVDPTGVADSTAGINLAIAQWKARGAAELIVPAGIYLLSDTVKFDHPRLGVLTCAGRFISTVSGKAAVQIGSDSAACYGLTVTGLSVQRSTLDMQPDGSTTNSIAVLLKNFVYSSVEIREAYNCTEGVRCLGTVLSGSFSLNRIYLGYVKDNKINVRLTATDGGYCNDNMFFGGSLGHSGSYPNFTGTINLLEDYYAANELNGNRFFGTALEDVNAASVAAEINGLNTLLVAPRMENSAGGVYPFKFTTHSQSCMLIGLGYEWFSEDIENLGAGNSWDSSDMLFRSARTPDAANIAVMMLQSRSTNLAKLLGGRDTSGNLTSYIRGDGHALLQRLNIAGIPIYANNAAAVSGGLVSGDVYRTTTGEARVVTP